MSTTKRTQGLIRSNVCYSVSGCRFDPPKGHLYVVHARHLGPGLARIT